VYGTLKLRKPSKFLQGSAKQLTVKNEVKARVSLACLGEPSSQSVANQIATWFSRTDFAPPLALQALQLLCKDHRLPGMVLEYRMVSRMVVASIEPFLRKAVRCEDGQWRVHCEWFNTRTATGRLSTCNPNIQVRPYSDAKVANRTGWERPFRDARRVPSTGLYPVPRAIRTTRSLGYVHRLRASLCCQP
jgi:hypothetical protein